MDFDINILTIGYWDREYSISATVRIHCVKKLDIFDGCDVSSALGLVRYHDPDSRYTEHACSTR